MIKIVTFSLLIISFGGCKLGKQSAKDQKSQIKQIKKAKKKIDKLSHDKIYSQKQHNVLKSYFRTTTELFPKLSESKKLKKYLAKDTENICDSYIIEKSTWEKIVKNCNRSQYFLCSQEILVFPKLTALISESNIVCPTW